MLQPCIAFKHRYSSKEAYLRDTIQMQQPIQIPLILYGAAEAANETRSWAVWKSIDWHDAVKAHHMQ